MCSLKYMYVKKKKKKKKKGLFLDILHGPSHAHTPIASRATQEGGGQE